MIKAKIGNRKHPYVCREMAIEGLAKPYQVQAMAVPHALPSEIHYDKTHKTLQERN